MRTIMNESRSACIVWVNDNPTLVPGTCLCSVPSFIHSIILLFCMSHSTDTDPQSINNPTYDDNSRYTIGIMENPVFSEHEKMEEVEHAAAMMAKQKEAEVG